MSSTRDRGRRSRSRSRSRSPYRRRSPDRGRGYDDAYRRRSPDRGRDKDTYRHRSPDRDRDRNYGTRDRDRDAAALDENGRIIASLSAESPERLSGEGPATIQIRGYGGSSATYTLTLTAF